MRLIRPIRVELWRNGELVDESTVNQLGVLTKPLDALAGDIVYPVWEAYADDSVPLVRAMQIRRVT